MTVDQHESQAAVVSSTELWGFPNPFLREHRVLVIEDDPQMRKTMTRRLHRAGYEVDVAKDGRDGLDLAFEVEPDAILLDLGLPRMHGFTLLHEIRNGLWDVPLMIVTGDHNPGVVDQASAFGVNYVFQKPFPLGQLMRALQVTLGER